MVSKYKIYLTSIIFLIFLIIPSLEAETTIVLSNSTGVYSGYVDLYTDPGNDRVENPDYLLSGLYVNIPLAYLISSFLEFNTSLIPDGANITSVFLNLTTANYSGILDKRYGNESTNITRLNNSRISSNITYPTNQTGNSRLFQDITYGNVSGGKQYRSDLYLMPPPYREYSINLTSLACNDLQNQLSQDFFSLGITLTNPVWNINYNYTSFNGTIGGGDISGPKLIITYIYNESCIPPVSGDWVINQTCYIFNKSYRVPANLLMQDKGWLLLNQSLLNFNVTTEQRIKIYPGGRVQLYNGSRIK